MTRKQSMDLLLDDNLTPFGIFCMDEVKFYLEENNLTANEDELVELSEYLLKNSERWIDEEEIHNLLADKLKEKH